MLLGCGEHVSHPVPLRDLLSRHHPGSRGALLEREARQLRSARARDRAGGAIPAGGGISPAVRRQARPLVDTMEARMLRRSKMHLPRLSASLRVVLLAGLLLPLSLAGGI